MHFGINKKAQEQGCFINLEQAFDTLYHKILLLMSNLDSYGFSGRSAILLVVTYRIKFVPHNRTYTPNVETGVPQGSVIGRCKEAIFADDTTIIKDN